MRLAHYVVVRGSDMKNRILQIVGITALAMALSGCSSAPPTEAELTASYARLEASQRENAEPIPQQFAAEAAKTFSEGKAYFIWLNEQELSMIRSRQPGDLKVHYAIAPDKQTLSRAEAFVFPLSKFYTKDGHVNVTEGLPDFARIKGSGEIQLYFGPPFKFGEKRDFSHDEERAFSNVLSIHIGP